MSSVIWGSWGVPKVEFGPYNCPNIDDLKRRVFLDIGQRLKWDKSHLILDGAIHTSGWGIKNAKRLMAGFRILLGVTGGVFVGFEVVARKYSTFSGSYLKVIFRIVGVVGLVFMACRYWGAYCYKKEVEKQIIQVANDRADFYQRKQRSDLTTQVLLSAEGEYWAEQLDVPFAEWLKKNSQETTVPQIGMKDEIDVFLKDPPFKNSTNCSKQILDRCIDRSPIVTSYNTFAEVLKKRKNEIEQYEVHVMQIVTNSRPQIKNITTTTLYNRYGEKESGHYCELAYRSLIPEEFKKAIELIKTDTERARIEKQLYNEFNQWKMRLKNYRDGKAYWVYISKLETIGPGSPFDSTLEQEVSAISVQQWKMAALKAQPEQGTQERYKRYIETVSQGGELGWDELANLPRMVTNG